MGGCPWVKWRTLRSSCLPVDWCVCLCMCWGTWLWGNSFGLSFSFPGTNPGKLLQVSLNSIPPQRTLTAETDHMWRPHTNRLDSGGWPWLRVPLFAQQQPCRNSSWTTFPTHLRVGGWKERGWSGLISLEALAESTPETISACCKPKLGWFVCWL